MVSNFFETTINDQKVGFKCGALAIAIACRESGCKTINELFAKMAEQDLLAILALFYGAACQYSGKKAPELTMDMVSDYLEAMGEDEANKATLVMLEAFKPKKATAPKKGANP